VLARQPVRAIATKVDVIVRSNFFMIFYEIIYHRPLLEKMPIAFFNISRSNSASLSLFF